MYQLKSSICLGRTIGSQWQEADLTHVLMGAAYQEYKNFYLILSHPAEAQDLYVDMRLLAIEVYGFQGTVGEWVEQLGDRTLPFTTEIPNTKRKLVKYANAVQAGYNVRQARAGFHYDVDVPLGMFDDISLSRDQFKTDMSLFGHGCLITINGYIHKTVTDNKLAFALGGAKTGRKSQETSVGILSFLDVGKIQQISIDPESVQPIDSVVPIHESLVFSIDADLENQSVFLVLGGYPVFIDNFNFAQIGTKTFRLNLDNLSFLERFMESREHLDFDSMGLTTPIHGENSVDLNELFSLAFIKKYLTLPQTFIVAVDTPNLTIEKFPVQNASFPGQFFHSEDPVFPLQAGYGRLLDYWKTNELDRWSVQCGRTFYPRFVLTERDRERAQYATGALDTTRRHEHMQGAFIEISTIKE